MYRSFGSHQMRRVWLGWFVALDLGDMFSRPSMSQFTHLFSFANPLSSPYHVRPRGPKPRLPDPGQLPRSASPRRLPNPRLGHALIEHSLTRTSLESRSEA